MIPLGDPNVTDGREFEATTKGVAGEDDDERDTKTCELKARWPARVQSRSTSSGCRPPQAAMSPPAQKACLAGENRDAGFGRSLNSTRSVKEGIDHGTIECIEFVDSAQVRARTQNLVTDGTRIGWGLRWLKLQIKGFRLVKRRIHFARKSFAMR